MASPWTEPQLVYVGNVFRYSTHARACSVAYPNMSRHNWAKYATELEAMPHIKAYLAIRRREAAEARSATSERVLDELCKRAFSNASDLVKIGDDGKPVLDLANAPPDALALIVGMEQETRMERDPNDPDGGLRPVHVVKIKTESSTRALELLGKHFKLFTERVEFDGSVDVGTLINDARARRRAALAGKPKA